MTTRQLNLRAMLGNTSDVLAQIPTRRLTPILTTRIAELKAALDEINSLAQQQAAPLESHLIVRSEAIAAAAEKTLLLAGIALSHATAHNIEPLASGVRIAPGRFRHGRHDRRVALCRTVAATLRGEQATNLADSPITVDLLDELDASIELAEQAVRAPRNVVSSRRTATGELVIALKKADRLVRDGIDPLIYPLRLIAPEFYALYRAARETIHRPATHHRADGPGAAKASTSPTASGPGAVAAAGAHSHPQPLAA